MGTLARSFGSLGILLHSPNSGSGPIRTAAIAPASGLAAAGDAVIEGLIQHSGRHDCWFGNVFRTGD